MQQYFYNTGLEKKRTEEKTQFLDYTKRKRNEKKKKLISTACDTMKRILWENCFCKSRFNFESLRMFLECCIRHLFFGCGDCKVADLSFYYHRVERSRTKILLLYLRLETNAYIASGVRFLFFCCNFCIECYLTVKPIIDPYLVTFSLAV